MKVADLYLGSVAVVSKDVDISWDWGGGGVVSTAPELATFMRALVEGKLFGKSESLTAMLNFLPVIVADGKTLVSYGLGIRQETTDMGPVWGHKGAWGGYMAYYPKLNLVITVSVNAFGTSLAKEAVQDLAKLYVVNISPIDR